MVGSQAVYGSQGIVFQKLTGCISAVSLGVLSARDSELVFLSLENFRMLAAELPIKQMSIAGAEYARKCNKIRKELFLVVPLVCYLNQLPVLL